MKGSPDLYPDAVSLGGERKRGGRETSRRSASKGKKKKGDQHGFFFIPMYDIVEPRCRKGKGEERKVGRPLLSILEGEEKKREDGGARRAPVDHLRPADAGGKRKGRERGKTLRCV